MRGRPLQLCAQRVFVRRIKEIPAAVCAGACCYVRGLEGLKGSAAECADQTAICSKLNKNAVCGRSPYTGGEPR